VDHVTGNREPVETLWTVDRDLALRQDSDEAYRASSEQSGEQMQIAFASLLGGPVAPEVIKGRIQPFAGWTVVDDVPAETYSLRFERGAVESATAYLFSLARAGADVAGGFEKVTFDRPDRWELVISSGNEKMRVRRDGPEIVYAKANSTRHIALATVSIASQASPSMDLAIQKAISEYPRWRDYRYYRLRFLAVMAVLWAGSLLASAVLFRFGTPYRYLDVTSAALWICLGLWLNFRYFQ
jgi:hypothetical protein